jgi:hypothetical protein
LTPVQRHRFLVVLTDPDTIIGTSVLIAAWGRSPH